MIANVIKLFVKIGAAVNVKNTLEIMKKKIPVCVIKMKSGIVK